MNDTVHLEISQPGNFWQGFLISMAAWILDVELAITLFGWALWNRNSGPWSLWENFTRSLSSPMTIVFAIVLALIWLPVAVIAGFRARNKGFKASLWLVLLAFILAPIIIGCSFTVIVGLSG